MRTPNFDHRNVRPLKLGCGFLGFLGFFFIPSDFFRQGLKNG